MQSRSTRLAPLSGVGLFLGLLVGFVILGGSTPDPDASPAKVVRFYTDNRGQQQATALLIALGAVTMLWFSVVLWREVRARGGDMLAVAMAVGGATMSIGYMAMACTHFALADSAHKIDPVAAQALNAADGGSWIISMGGTLFLTVALVAAILKLGVLPRGFAYVLGVLAIATPTPVGWAAWLLTPVVLAVAAIVLFVRGGRAAAPPAPAEPRAAVAA